MLTSAFPGGSDGKESTCNVGGLVSIPGLGRSTGEGHETHSRILAWTNPIDRGACKLQSMGLQRVRHDWATKHNTKTHYLWQNIGIKEK